MISSKYEQAHVACPDCGNEDVARTTGPDIWCGLMDGNKAWCTCGWQGRVHDLVPAGG